MKASVFNQSKKLNSDYPEEKGFGTDSQIVNILMGKDMYIKRKKTSLKISRRQLSYTKKINK